MREYGSVQTQFWPDLALQNLSTHAKLLAVYLLTGPHTNMLGCFRLPTGEMGGRLVKSSLKSI